MAVTREGTRIEKVVVGAVMVGAQDILRAANKGYRGSKFTSSSTLYRHLNRLVDEGKLRRSVSADRKFLFTWQTPFEKSESHKEAAA